MKRFKLLCSQCGSDNVVEKSGQSKLDWAGDNAIYGEGIQRKCLDCNNESFVIFKTWQQQE